MPQTTPFPFSADQGSTRGEARMRGPANLRVYGVLVRNETVLVAAEQVAGRDVLKFPGGGVDENETPEMALCREFGEECGLDIRISRLVHVPGTLFSPWTHTNYTPLYYQVEADGDPSVPDGESLTLSFMDMENALKSGRMAGPELFALSRVLGAVG